MTRFLSANRVHLAGKRYIVLAAAVAGIGTAWAARAEEAFVTNQLSENLTVVDLATSRPVATIAIGGKPAGVAVTPDGRFAYVTHSTPELSVVDLGNVE